MRANQSLLPLAIADTIPASTQITLKARLEKTARHRITSITEPKSQCFDTTTMTSITTLPKSTVTIFHRDNALLRVIIAISMGSIFTSILLFGLLSLIASDSAPRKSIVEGNKIDFIRVQKEEVINKQTRKMQKPPKPNQPPPAQLSPKSTAVKMEASNFEMSTPITAPEIELSAGLGFNVSDGDYIPLVKVEPMYPRRARARGQEGFVLLEFTITRNGTVRDAIVISSEPKGVFDEVALEAARKFRYRPKSLNGETVEVTGVQNKFVFKLKRKKKQ